MSQVLAPLGRLALIIVLTIAAGCGGGGGGGGGGNGDGTGTLTFSVGGLPAGVNAPIVVAGPNGFTQTLLTNQASLDVAPGTYTLTASRILVGDTFFAPLQPQQAFIVSSGATASATVNFSAQEVLRLTLQPIVAGLSSPLFLTAPPGDARLFIVEREGRVRIARNGLLVGLPFLDISERVSTAGEGGLLSIAFHPQYASNGFVFVYFTDLTGDIAIERFRVRADDPDRLDALAPLRILTIPHRNFGNHKGGLAAFGPDGFLYLGTGDGGGSGDPFGNGQNLGTLLGKLLRIDVGSASATQPYAIPPQNPFVGQTGRRGEIWAYGLRNPWRYAFDATTGLLYIADVGQNRREEVNVANATVPGLNYGWDIIEGSLCFPTDPCSTAGLTLPLLEYGHDADGGCTIIGGFVYRGSAIPDLRGRYFYSDLCSGFLRSLVAANGTATERVDWNIVPPGQVLSFGEDAQKELYLMTEDGGVFKVVVQ